MRSKHIGADQVKRADVDTASLASVFGNGTLGGKVEGVSVGAFSSSTKSLPVFGLDTTAANENFSLLLPASTTARDLHFKLDSGSIPADREVTMRLKLFNQSEPTLECTLTSSISECDSGSSVMQLSEGDVLAAQLTTPNSSTALPDTDYLFSYRLAP